MAFGKLNHILSALPLDLDKQGVGSPDTAGEGRVPHCSANLVIATLVGEVNHFPLKLDARHIFAKIDPRHTPTPLAAEQTSNDGLTQVKVNALTNPVIGRYLPTALFERPAAGAS